MNRKKEGYKKVKIIQLIKDFIFAVVLIVVVVLIFVLIFVVHRYNPSA